MRRLLLATLLLIGCDRDADNRPSPGQDPPEVEIPAPPPEPIVAINIQPPTPDRVDQVLEALLELRIQHVRASWWAWSSADSTLPGNWAWLPEYQAAGIEVLPLVYPHNVPGEESGASMAARYRTLFDAFGPFPYVQLGNEVDGEGNFAWVSRVNGGLVPDGRDPFEQGVRWGIETREAAELIHAFDPEVRIVTAGLAWNAEGVQDFTRGMVSVGGFHVVAIHGYGDQIFGEVLSRWEAIRRQGWTGPIWVTEWGTSQAHVARFPHMTADEIQLENWRKVLSEDASRFGYERMYGFQLVPDPESFGVLRYPGWEPRPAYLWLRTWQEGR